MGVPGPVPLPIIGNNWLLYKKVTNRLKINVDLLHPFIVNWDPVLFIFKVSKVCFKRQFLLVHVYEYPFLFLFLANFQSECTL